MKCVVSLVPVSPPRLMTSPLSSPSGAVASPTAGDPVTRSVKLVLACRKAWGEHLKEGKGIVEEMAETRKEMLDSGDKSYSPVLQEQCDRLGKVLDSMQEQVDVMTHLDGRLAAAAELQEMKNSTEDAICPTRKMAKAVNTLQDALKQQIQVTLTCNCTPCHKVPVYRVCNWCFGPLSGEQVGVGRAPRVSQRDKTGLLFCGLGPRALLRRRVREKHPDAGVFCLLKEVKVRRKAMSANRQDSFAFKVDFEKVLPSCTLWALRANRPAEFRAILAALESSPEDLEAIRSNAKGQVPEVADGHEPVAFLDACAGAGVDLEWLTRAAVDSPVEILLLSLMCGHRPLRLVKDLPRQLELELGSSAKACPTTK